MSKVLFLDLETTGLDPRVHSIIEVGAIITDESLTEIEPYHYIIGESPSWNWSQYALRMHEANGLLDKCRAHKTGRLYEAERGLIKFLYDHVGQSEFPIILAGNSIHFDKKFIEVHMPELNKLLHYRMIDISGALEAIRIFNGKEILRLEPKHRVIDDVRDSMELTRKFIEQVK